MTVHPSLLLAALALALSGAPTSAAHGGQVTVGAGGAAPHYQSTYPAPYRATSQAGHGIPPYGSPRIDVDQYGAPRLPGGFQRGGDFHGDYPYDDYGWRDHRRHDRRDHRDPRHRDRAAYRFVPGHWESVRYGRVWVPGRYVLLPRGHGRHHRDYRRGDGDHRPRGRHPR